MIASCKPIADNADDNQPPHLEAQRAYQHFSGGKALCDDGVSDKIESEAASVQHRLKGHPAISNNQQYADSITGNREQDYRMGFDQCTPKHAS